MKNNHSIRFKVVTAMLSVAIVSLITVGFAALTNLKNNAYEDAVQRLTNITHLQKERIKNFIRQNQERVEIIASIPQLKVSLFRHSSDPGAGDLETVLDIIKNLKTEIDDFILIQIIDLKGNVIASTESRNVGHKDKHAYHQHQDHQVDSFKLDIDLDDESHHFAVLKQPILYNNHYLGYLDVHTSLVKLNQIVNDYKGMGKTGETILAKKLPNGDARFLTSMRFDPNPGLRRTIAASRLDIPIIRALEADIGFHENIVDYREVPVYAVTEFIAETAWGVLNKIDQSEVYEDYDRYSFIFIILFSTIIILTMIISTFIAYSVTNPIRKLTEYVKHDNHVKISDVESYANDHESRELGLSLASMYKDLQIKQQQLIAAKESAEMANREKSRFLSNMSHELRTPMHAILSFASMALKKPDDQEKVVRYLNNIKISGNRLTNLLNDLLDLAKLESGKIELDLNIEDVTAVVEYALTEVESLIAEKSITIEFDNSQYFECYLDRKLIIQVLINLFSNAIKFSPSESKISILLDKHEMVLGDGIQEAIKISVIDEGIGIPQNELGHVFDKFIQSSKTQTQAGGTGLGLPITKEIIELHSGKIWAESSSGNLDKGSVFKILLPVKQAEENPEIRL